MVKVRRKVRIEDFKDILVLRSRCWSDYDVQKVNLYRTSKRVVREQMNKEINPTTEINSDEYVKERFVTEHFKSQ